MRWQENDCRRMSDPPAAEAALNGERRQGVRLAGKGSAIAEIAWANQGIWGRDRWGAELGVRRGMGGSREQERGEEQRREQRGFAGGGDRDAAMVT